MLLWQDLRCSGLQPHGAPGGPPPGRRRSTCSPPPVAFVWCGHNEPMALVRRAGHLGSRRSRRRLALRMAASQALPSWNRSLTRPAIKTVLERDDGTRPVVAPPGYSPICLSSTAPTATLARMVRREERDLPGLLARWPRLDRFVGEFGATGRADHDDFVEPDRWPDLDWDRLAQHHALQSRCSTVNVPPAESPPTRTGRTHRDYQARLVRYHVETLRRLKYQPTGGFTQFVLADSSPRQRRALDHERAPKPAFAPARRLPGPVIVVAGTGARARAPRTTCRSTCTWSATPYRHFAIWFCVPSVIRNGATACVSWSGTILPDTCVRVGRLEIDVPDSRADSRTEPSDHGNGPVALVVDFELVGDGLDVTTRYGTWVVAGAHEH